MPEVQPRITYDDKGALTAIHWGEELTPKMDHALGLVERDSRFTIVEGLGRFSV